MKFLASKAKVKRFFNPMCVEDYSMTILIQFESSDCPPITKDEIGIIVDIGKAWRERVSRDLLELCIRSQKPLPKSPTATILK